MNDPLEKTRLKVTGLLVDEISDMGERFAAELSGCIWELYAAEIERVTKEKDLYAQGLTQIAAERDTLKNRNIILNDALLHMGWCRSCGNGNLGECCDEGAKLKDALAQSEEVL